MNSIIWSDASRSPLRPNCLRYDSRDSAVVRTNTASLIPLVYATDNRVILLKILVVFFLSSVVLNAVP